MRPEPKVPDAAYFSDWGWNPILEDMIAKIRTDAAAWAIKELAGDVSLSLDSDRPGELTLYAFDGALDVPIESLTTELFLMASDGECGKWLDYLEAVVKRLRKINETFDYSEDRYLLAEKIADEIREQLSAAAPNECARHQPQQ